MLFNKKRRDLLIEALYHRINSIREQLPTLDEVSARKVAALMETALVMIEKFKAPLSAPGIFAGWFSKS